MKRSGSCGRNGGRLDGGARGLGQLIISRVAPAVGMRMRSGSKVREHSLGAGSWERHGAWQVVEGRGAEVCAGHWRWSRPASRPTSGEGLAHASRAGLAFALRDRPGPAASPPHPAACKRQPDSRADPLIHAQAISIEFPSLVRPSKHHHPTPATISDHAAPPHHCRQGELAHPQPFGALRRGLPLSAHVAPQDRNSAAAPHRSRPPA